MYKQTVANRLLEVDTLCQGCPLPVLVQCVISMRALAILIVLALVAPGCAQALGDRCNQSHQCEGGLVCVDGRCTLSAPAEPLATIPLQEEIVLDGLNEPVEIVIDEWETPHIYARSLVDGWTGIGFIMARHRLAQLELERRAARGELASVVERSVDDALFRDAMVRLLSLDRIGEASWEITPAQEADGQALIGFSRGVTAYISRVHSDAEAIGDPAQRLVEEASPQWTVGDSLAVAAMEALRQTWKADEELELHLLLERQERDFRRDSPHFDFALRAGFADDVVRFDPLVESPLIGTNVDEESSRGALAPRPSVDIPQLVEGWLRSLRLVSDLAGVSGQDDTAWVATGQVSHSGGAVLAAVLTEPSITPPLHYTLHLVVNDGQNSLEVAGLCRVGVPELIVGFNRDIAWAKLPSRADLVDLYLEEIRTVDGERAVLINDTYVPVSPMTVDIEGSEGQWTLESGVVPHHGPFVPILGEEEMEGGVDDIVGLTVRWAGQQPSRSLAASHALSQTSSVREAVSDVREFLTPDTSWLLADRHGHTASVSPTGGPERETSSLPPFPLHLLSSAPLAVMPGIGGGEWTSSGDRESTEGTMAAVFDGPSQEFFVVGGADYTGSTIDNNPFSGDAPYLGWQFEPGFRTAELMGLLGLYQPRHRMTLDDAEAVITDTSSHVLDGLISAVEIALERALREREENGTEPDLMRLVNELGSRLDEVELAVEHLKDWDRTYPLGDAVEDRANSIAAAIAGAWLPRCFEAVLGDELAHLGTPLNDDMSIRALIRLVAGTDPIRTIDVGLGYSSLFDDLDTENRYESRDERLLRSLDQTLEWLEDRLGDELTEWRWGDIHRVSFVGLPLTRDSWGAIDGEGDGLSIPGGPWSLWTLGQSTMETESATEGGIPGARLLVDMAPSGPQGRVVLAGSQNGAPDSADYGGEIELWRQGDMRPLAFDLEEVVDHGSYRISLIPAQR